MVSNKIMTEVYIRQKNIMEKNFSKKDLQCKQVSTIQTVDRERQCVHERHGLTSEQATALKTHNNLQAHDSWQKITLSPNKTKNQMQYYLAIKIHAGPLRVCNHSWSFLLSFVF